MMVVLTRVMMPVVLMVGVYIFLRGHNEPGGGFVSGLVVAIGVVMQYMASGFAWAERRRDTNHGAARAEDGRDGPLRPESADQPCAPDEPRADH